MADFLYRHRNLFMFSNQGWEALNALVKQVYFRRTARGGGKWKKTRLFPIARWLQRRLVFTLVKDEEEANALLRKLEINAENTADYTEDAAHDDVNDNWVSHDL